MADENKKSDIKETLGSLKALRDQASAVNGINVEFKESIDLLTKMNKLIENSVAKTQSFEKSTINTKRLQTELEKIEKERKKVLSDIAGRDQTQAKEYIENLEKRKNLEDKLIRSRGAGNSAATIALQSQLRSIQSVISAQESSLQTEDLMLIALTQQQQSLDERVEGLDDEIRKEKEIANKIGLAGNLLKLSNKYLGIGGDLYGKIVAETREGENTTKKWVYTVGALVGSISLVSKGFSAVNKGIGSITGTGGPISKLVSPFTELISKIPIVGGLIGGVVDMLAGVADYATEAGSQVQLFARNLAISVDDATKLNAQYSNIAHNSGDLLFNAKKFRETQLEISEATGLNNLLSEKSLQTQIQLKELAGTDLETRKELTNVERISGVQQDKIVKASMGTSAYIKQTLGVSIKWQSILKEATSLSGVLGLSFAKYPEKLTRSLATVKSMGLELKQLDGIADSFLDFESSISKEFEAQLLTGKDINLTKAREAFLNNDLVAAGKELVNQLGTSGEFLSYNRIQQDALAASAGMTRDQVADMLKQQELFSKLQVNDIKAYQQKVSLMTQTVEGQKELVGLLGEEEYSKVMSQTATEKIANFIEKIKQSFADLLSSSSFKGFLDQVLKFISDPKNIETFISKITGFVSTMISAIAGVVNALDYITFGSIDNKIIDNLNSYADEIGGLKIGSLAPAGASVQKNQAQSAIGGGGSAGSVDNMSMARSSGQQQINVAVTTTVSDHKKDAEVRIGMAPNQDLNTKYN
jgi:hypothetical protein